MSQHQPELVVAGYDATDEASDGLALARLLADRIRRRLLVARVVPDLVDSTQLTRPEQLQLRCVASQTRRAILAVVPDEDLEIIPVLEQRVAHGLPALAVEQEPELLVLGSSHHGRVGRILLGGSAEALVDHAPCPVAVAPPGFRTLAEIMPPVVGVAWDGSTPSREAMRVATALAADLGLALTVITVGTAGLEAGVTLARSLVPAAVEVSGLGPSGNPARELVAATDHDVGLLVVGSHRRAAPARILMGSVARAVVRHAHAPVVVVPGP